MVKVQGRTRSPQAKSSKRKHVKRLKARSCNPNPVFRKANTYVKRYKIVQETHPRTRIQCFICAPVLTPSQTRCNCRILKIVCRTSLSLKKSPVCTGLCPQNGLVFSGLCCRGMMAPTAKALYQSQSRLPPKHRHEALPPAHLLHLLSAFIQCALSGR